VVPAEMPSSWPREALRAQSIAARSFAARRLRPGVSWYDVADDTTSQVYLGVEGEKAATDTAISDTAGTVLMSGSTIANTLFHSAGGGATEHNENVYVSSTGVKVASPVSYLRGVADRRDDGSTYDSTSPYATWATDTYTRTALSGIFAGDSRTNVGTLAALDLRARGVSGRLIRVTLYGSLGSKTVSGDVFRSVFNARRPSGDPSMRSTLVDTTPVP
jgi:stage II sporulation protein D